MQRKKSGHEAIIETSAIARINVFGRPTWRRTQIAEADILVGRIGSPDRLYDWKPPNNAVYVQKRSRRAAWVRVSYEHRNGLHEYITDVTTLASKRPLHLTYLTIKETKSITVVPTAKVKAATKPIGSSTKEGKLVNVIHHVRGNQTKK